MALLHDTCTQRELALHEEFESLTAEIAALEARRAQVMAERFDLLLEDDPFLSPQHDIAVRSLVAEWAATAHLSHAVMEGMMCRAHTLEHRFLRVWRAWSDGIITHRHVDVILQCATALNAASPEHWSEYEARVSIMRSWRLPVAPRPRRR